MEAILLGIYGFFVWLIFIKLRWLPWNITSQVIVAIIPIVGLTVLILMLNVFAPSSADVRVFKYTVPIVSQVRGRVIEVAVEEGNRLVKKGDVLFKIDPEPYKLAVNQLAAQLANAEASQRELDEQLKAARAATEIDFGRATSYFVVTIPLQWFLQWRLPEHFVQPLLQGLLVSEPTSERAVSDSQQFAHWEEDLQREGAELQKAVLLEMQARLVRLALNLPVRTKPAIKRGRLATVTDTGLNKVEQMACFIAQNYTESLTVRQIGEYVKLHPNYAMNLFQKTFGTTLINYLTQHRLSHAQRLLATTEQSITEIAFNSGFNSISRFNDAFRRACGCSPREYRRSHLLDEPSVARDA